MKHLKLFEAFENKDLVKKEIDDILQHLTDEGFYVRNNCDRHAITIEISGKNFKWSDVSDDLYHATEYLKSIGAKFSISIILDESNQKYNRLTWEETESIGIFKDSKNDLIKLVFLQFINNDDIDESFKLNETRVSDDEQKDIVDICLDLTDIGYSIYFMDGFDYRNTFIDGERVLGEKSDFGLTIRYNYSSFKYNLVREVVDHIERYMKMKGYKTYINKFYNKKNRFEFTDNLFYLILGFEKI